MDKLEKLQELARSVAKDEQTSFIADQNNINAQRFTKSVELYFRSITEVDCDCMKKFVTNLYEGGYLSDTLALLMGASGNYEAHIDALESLRQARISNYNYMIQYCKCGFRLESESSFLYYFPPEDTEIPITGLSLEPLQSINSYPEGIDLQVGDFITLFPIYTPSNTTQTGVIYSSSDESIVDVGTSGILFGESVGTATITVTSIYDKNIKTSIDIRVGEKTESSGEPGEIVIPESDFEYTIIDGKVIITGLKNENIKTAKIPSRIEGYPVTSIGNYAFYECTRLTSITIPDSVTSIGDAAFFNCTRLTNITIPDGVISIGNSAFSCCADLTSITIPDSVTSIGNSTFSGCIRLTNVYYTGDVANWCSIAFNDHYSNPMYWVNNFYINGKKVEGEIVIPNGVESIGNYAFFYCTGLTNITIPNSVTSIGYSAFSGCSGLTSVTIPNSVTSIGYRAFSDCTGLTSVTIPDSVTSMGDLAFLDCSNLTEASLPCGLQIIEGDSSYVSGFFTSCDNLTKLTITRGSDGMFTGLFGTYMDSVKEIEFANGVTEICSEAIFYLKSLESVIIPCSVTNIDNHAFYECENLKNIVIPGDIENVGNSPFSGCYPENIVIAEGSAVINNHFLGCLMNTYDSVIRLSISDSVTDISEGCLNSFSNLEKIIVSSNNKCYSSDEYGVLFNKDKTQLIQYPIGNAKSEYSIPNSVTSIGQYAFLSCYKLTNIEIPNSVTSISDYAFAGCTGLTSETIPDSVTSIGSDAFGCCTNLINITIPASLKTIYDDAFQQCENLTNVYYTGTLAEWCSIELYGKEASPMCYAKNLYIDGKKIEGDITIPDGVTKIGWCSFRNCDNLKSVTIPNSVTEIDDWAFENCISLTDVYYEGTEEQWDKIHLYYWGNDYLIDATIHYNCTPCTHILSHINNNATCTKPGTEYDLCSKCGAKLNFKSIPATGHNWSAWTTTSVPTVKDDGIEKRICSVCGEEETRIITKLNGVYDDSTGIEVIFESESCSATELRVEKSQSDEVLAILKTVSKNSNIAVYDIATYDNGIKVQPNEKVTVRIPIPDGFNLDMIAVYYVDTESDSLIRIPNRVEYGYVVFETDHFSYYAVVDETVLNLSIKKPSTTTINYGDSIVLHVESNIELPAGSRIEWTADNGNFSMSTSADGTTCKISPKSSGKTVFTATVYDKDGNVISSDTQEMNAKAGLWQKIVAFFKKIFGLTKTFPEAFKGIF